MPLIAAFFASLASMIVPLAIRAVAGVGVGFAVYEGVGALFDSIETQILAKFGELPADILDVMAVLNVDVGIKVLLSAMGIRLLFAGLNASGAVSRVRWNRPTA